MANLSDRIKELRLSADMTQEEFGKKFGIVKSTVSLYESGKSTPNDELKKQICDYFNISVDYLLGVSDDKHRNSPSDDRGFFFFFFFDDKDLQEVFVSALKTALETQNMTVSELCEKTGIDVDTCNQYLTGEHAPTLEHLVELSKALDVSIDYLLGQVPKISQAEKKLLNAFENLSEDNQDIYHRENEGIAPGTAFR